MWLATPVIPGHARPANVAYDDYADSGVKRPLTMACATYGDLSVGFFEFKHKLDQCIYGCLRYGVVY